MCTRTCCSPVNRSTSPVLVPYMCATSGVLAEAGAWLAEALLVVAAEVRARGGVDQQAGCHVGDADTPDGPAWEDI